MNLFDYNSTLENVQCWHALPLHLVSMVFGTAIPTSHYIFGRCLIYMFVSFFFLLYNNLPPGTAAGLSFWCPHEIQTRRGKTVGEA